jgi:hypothetical protein
VREEENKKKGRGRGRTRGKETFDDKKIKKLEEGEGE